MRDTIQYVVNEEGQRESVLVPIEVWEEMQGQYKRLNRKIKILRSIQSGLEEVNKTRKTGKTLQSLKDLLT